MMRNARMSSSASSPAKRLAIAESVEVGVVKAGPALLFSSVNESPFGGADSLPHVPLGVLGDMDQQTANRGRQPHSSYCPGFGEVAGIESPHHRFRFGKSPVKSG